MTGPCPGPSFDTALRPRQICSTARRSRCALLSRRPSAVQKMTVRGVPRTESIVAYESPARNAAQISAPPLPTPVACREPWNRARGIGASLTGGLPCRST
jgi:hypothetical protein